MDSVHLFLVFLDRQVEQISFRTDPRDASRDAESEIESESENENENDEASTPEALETPVGLDRAVNLGTDAISPKKEGYVLLANHPLETVTRDFWKRCNLILE